MSFRFALAAASTISPARFGQEFVGRVANPADILLFFKKRSTAGAGKRKPGSKLDAAHAAAQRAEIGVLEALRENKGAEQIDIESMMSRLMRERKDNTTQVLQESALHRALKAFVDKDEKDALSDVLTSQIKQRTREVQSLTTLGFC